MSRMILKIIAAVVLAVVSLVLILSGNYFAGLISIGTLLLLLADMILIFLEVHRREPQAEGEVPIRRKLRKNKPEEVLPEKTQREFHRTNLPESVNGASLRYRGELDALEIPEDINIRAEIGWEEKQLRPVPAGDGTVDRLEFYNEDDRLVAVFRNPMQAKMVKDYLTGGNYVVAILKAPSAKHPQPWIRIGYYYSKLKYVGQRETEEFCLVGFKGPQRQSVLEHVEPGAELELEIDEERPERVYLLTQGECIGRLPPEAAEKYAKAGKCYVCVLDRVEQSFDVERGNLLTPYVRIYW